MLPVPMKGSYINFPGEAFCRAAHHHPAVTEWQQRGDTYQGLICHEKRYFGFHACVAEVLSLLDVERFDQRARGPLL